jgi:hypothetical protein
MPKTHRELEYESWRRRLQKALIDLECAASMWGGCISESEYCGEKEPQRRFVMAMDERLTAFDQDLSDLINQKLWDLVEDMQKAIESGEEGIRALKEKRSDEGADAKG